VHDRLPKLGSDTLAVVKDAERLPTKLVSGDGKSGRRPIARDGTSGVMRRPAPRSNQVIER
jgi:hypothetical protein